MLRNVMQLSIIIKRIQTQDKMITFITTLLSDFQSLKVGNEINL